MDGSRVRGRTRAVTAAAATAVVAVLVAAPASAVPAPTARLDDVRAGTVEPVDLQVPGRGAAAHRISESGVVVGVAYTDEGGVRAFRWEDGVADVLTEPAVDSSSVDVNADGQVLVQTYLEDGSSGVVLWQPDGTVVDLTSAASPTTGDVYASDLDDHGRVALDLYDATTGDAHAAVWQDGTLTLLDDGDGESRLGGSGALNERGDVAGTVTSGDGPRAVVWRDGVATALPLPAGATASYGDAVNERGDVLGAVREGTRTRAVLWHDGRVRYLVAGDAPRQSFYDLNDRGVAVGTVGDQQVVLHAALADRRGLTLLPTLGGPSGTAYAVNDRGTAVGTTTTGLTAAYGHAVAWVRGVAVPLSGWVDDEEPVNSVALDVDEHGRAVGYVQRRDPGGSLSFNMRALLWEVPRS